MLKELIVSLDIMWKGMAGIFSVISIITILVVILQRTELFFSDRANNKKNKENKV